jgi:hypothetical protein
MQRTGGSLNDINRNSTAPMKLEAFKARGVESVFPQKDHAIDYAQSRACFRLGEVGFSIQSAMSRVSFRSTKRIESYEMAVIEPMPDA